MHHPTVARIRADILADNFRKMAGHFAPSEVMAVVKANAYGHGLVECARICQEAGARWFGVASVQEGLVLRQAGLNDPVLVFGGILPDYLSPAIEAGLDLTVSSLDKLREVERIAGELKKRPRVHLKIDTGMERIGVHDYSCGPFLEQAALSEKLEVIGVYSHLAKTSDKEFTKDQISRFDKATTGLEVRGRTVMRHLSASAGAFGYESSGFDMVRPGIALYGCMKTELELEPVMRLVSRVVYFKVVKEGAGVSYSHRWYAPCQTRIATVAIGYGDGAFQRMSSNREVVIRGKRYPVVGTVCMDQLMVDLGPDGEAYNGDEVTVIGDGIAAEEIASIRGTVPHEVVTAISARVPRTYVNNG